MKRGLAAVALAGGLLSLWGGPAAHAGAAYTIVGPNPLIAATEMAFTAGHCNPALANQAYNLGSAAIDVGPWSGRLLQINVTGTQGLFASLLVDYYDANCSAIGYGPATTTTGVWNLQLPPGTKWAIVKNSSWPTATLNMP
ncbi:MAG: hypothetical protein QOI20_739 [Acidimicrobiaceae bacterium]|jgi:hypothetical protein|nr:hypothetical protein [Acidimicrobiaceae bacterium]